MQTKDRALLPDEMVVLVALEMSLTLAEEVEAAHVTSEAEKLRVARLVRLVQSAIAIVEAWGK